jgi:TRAP-type C4-dicarboxylate transport system permease small subunit
MYRALKTLDAVLSWLCVAITGVMTLLVVFAVLLRYLFGIAIIEMEETICILFSATTFLGAALAVREKSHIQVFNIADSLAPHARAVMRIAAMGGVIVVSATVLWTSLYWIDRIGGTKSLALQIPCGYYYVLIPLSFALVIFYALVDIAGLFVRIPEAERGYVDDSELLESGSHAGSDIPSLNAADRKGAL